MADVNGLLQSNLALVAGGLGAVVVLLLLVVLVQARRVSRLSRRLDAVTRGEDGTNLQGVLETHLDRVSSMGREVDELAARMAMLEGRGRRAFQGVGLVRYNAFEETGGNQSFALAVLDADAEGFVLSGLHARSGTRVYAKALTGGRADAALSDEEQQALEIAHGAASRKPGVAASAGRGSAR